LAVVDTAMEGARVAQKASVAITDRQRLESKLVSATDIGGLVEHDGDRGRQPAGWRGCARASRLP
jgi:hypothetical protein